MEWILLAIIGICVGIIAGMLGIGGGIFIVPLLSFIFNLNGMPDSLLMKCSIGTSLSIMVFTSISTIIAHYKRGNIVFDVIKRILIWIVLGTVVGSLVAHLINGGVLKILFGLFMIVIAFKMFWGFHPHEYRNRKLTNKILAIAGILIGFKSGILGIGGGSISVPFLSYFGFPMKKAVGTSTTFTFPIALCGAISFIIFGYQAINFPMTIGYIYWPAFLIITPLAVIFAPLGAKLSHIIPSRNLQIIFGWILILLSLKVLFYDIATV